LAEVSNPRPHLSEGPAGREIPGLVWGAVFSPEGRCSPLGPLDRDRLAGREGLVWLHLALSDQRVPALLAMLPDLPAFAVDTLLDRDPHTGFVVRDGVLHGILPDLQRSFEGDTREFGWLRFAVCDRLVVTTRLQPLRSVDRVRSVADLPGRITAPLDVLEAILGEFQRTLTRTVAEITEEMNRIEDFVFDDAPRDERRRLGPVRRLAARLHRQLRSVLTGLRKLETEDEVDVPEAVRTFAERVADRLERIDRDVLALQERARLLHEEIDSKISSETNRHLYVMSVMTAFLLPPTLVAGVFGMNTGGLPWQDRPDGTILAIALCALSVGGAWWLLRRTGIL
jgi:zinc transporter